MDTIARDRDGEIQQIIRSCGQQGKAFAAQGYEVSQKGPDDFVTSVDRLLDQQLSQQFSQLFPLDGIISEENAASLARYQAKFPQLWCIDPLDGTQDFIQGDLNYATLVGLLQAQQPIAGWIYAPEHDRMYAGGVDWGVWQWQADLKSPISVVPSESLPHRYRVLIGDKDRDRIGQQLSQQIDHIQFVRFPGSFGLKVMEVVLGRAELYLYCNQRVKLWDTVASVAIARAAGLVCCDLQGQPLRFTADALDLDTLRHHQSVVIGQKMYVEKLLPQISAALL